MTQTPEERVKELEAGLRFISSYWLPKWVRDKIAELLRTPPSTHPTACKECREREGK